MRQSDVIASIDKYLHDRYIDIPIYSSRKLENIRSDKGLRQRSDSYFGIGLINRTNIILGPGGFLDSDRWVIIYCGKDEDDVRDTIDNVTNQLNFDNNITGYLYNYSFKQPYVALIEDASKDSITPSDYDVAFTATKTIDSTFYETKISKSVRVNIPINTYIKIQFPKLPVYKTTFAGYNVYGKLTSSNDWLKVKEFEHGDDASCNFVGEVNSLDSLLPSQLPPDTFLMPYKNMMALKVYADVEENKLEDSFWSGYIMGDIQSPGFIEDSNNPLVGFINTTVRINTRG